MKRVLVLILFLTASSGVFAQVKGTRKPASPPKPGEYVCASNIGEGDKWLNSLEQVSATMTVVCDPDKPFQVISNKMTYSFCCVAKKP